MPIPRHLFGIADKMHVSIRAQVQNPSNRPATREKVRTWEELEVHVFLADSLKLVGAMGLIHQQEWNLLKQS